MEVEWKSPSPPMPPATWSGTLVVDEADEEVYLVVDGGWLEPPICDPSLQDSTIVWRWNGELFEPFAWDLIANEEAWGQATACWDPQRGEVCLYKLLEGEILRVGLRERREELITMEGLTRCSGGHLYSVYDRAQGRTLFQDDEQLYALEGESWRALPAQGFRMNLVYDVADQRVIGQGWGNDTYVLTEDDDWAVLTGEPSLNGSRMGYDHGRGKLVRMMADGGDRLRLWELDGDVWQRRDVTYPDYTSEGVLARAQKTGQLLHFGGQSGGNTNETLVLEPGEQVFVSSTPKENLYLGRHRMLGIAGDRLYVIDHSSKAVYRLEGGSWREEIGEVKHAEEYRGRFADHNIYDLAINFAVDPRGAFLMLEGSGGVMRAEPGGGWEYIGGKGGPVEGHYARRTAVGVDPERDRVVVFGGLEENATFVFDLEQRGWRELDATPRPRHGVGSIVSTPQGVYLLRDDELWLLEQDRWRCVATDADWHGGWLLYEPNRGLLLSTEGSVWGDAGDRIAAFDGERWRVVATIPEGWPIQAVGTGSVEVGVDPQGDRLVLVNERARNELDLASLELPEGVLPQAEVEPLNHLQMPPEEQMVPARALVLDPDSPCRSLSDWGIDASFAQGFEVHAILPFCEEMGVQYSFAALAVLTMRDGMDELENWWRFGSGLVQATFLEEYPLEEALINVDEGFQRANLRAFRELDPEEIERYHSLPAGQNVQSFGSKIGGFPRWIQGDADPGPGYSFAVQLSPDLFGSRFGDVGKLYLYLDRQQRNAVGGQQGH